MELDRIVLDKIKEDRSQFSLEQVRQLIAKIIDQDIRAVDFKFLIYKAACDKSLSNEKIFPRPPIFVYNSEPNKRLSELNESLPGLKFLRHYLRYPYMFEISREIFELVVWLILDLNEPDIQTVSPDYYESVINMVSSDPVFYPSIIFHVSFDKNSRQEHTWVRKSYQKWTKFAFYPCQVEKLHNIIYTNQIKDKKLVLYTNLNHCLDNTSHSWVWGKSIVGTNIKTICIVEFVDDPNFCRKISVSKKVKCETGCRIYEVKKYEISRPDCARVKYVLVYVLNDRVLQSNSVVAWESPFLKFCFIGFALLAGFTATRLLRYVLP